ncbi:MAG: Ig-like domain-containing protein [Mucinivorans sp.]
MRVLKQITRTIAWVVILAVTLHGCATISSPKGGPRDSLPPRIVGSNPAPYSLNFAGKKIEIEFSEYIQLKDQQKLFFMSPASLHRPALSIKNKFVVVEFRDTLTPETTYRLDFGSSIVDNNENNKLDGYSFVFSTGSTIDSLMMAGQVIDAATQDSVVGAFINYFDAKADSMKLDSTLFLSSAQAVFRTDSSGYFVGDILKDKAYRIYAILDNNGDQQYQAGTDMVAFVDSTYNPMELNPFMIDYDTAKRRVVIDSLQLRFEVFKEAARFRQNLISHARVGRNKLAFAFAAENARYDSLQLKGVEKEWLIEEKNEHGDSISLWIAPPSKEQYKALPDSISGTFVYQRQDSVFHFFPKKEKLNFYSKTFVKPEDKKAKKDTTTKVEKNTFTFQVSAAQTLNPEKGIGFTFNFPLRKIDSARVQLTKVMANTKSRDKNAPKIRTPEKFRFDSLSMRHYVLQAPWVLGAEYELMIPDSVFQDITFAANDTLSSKFTIADPDKFGTITLEIKADSTDTNHYVIELTQGRGKALRIVQRRTHIKSGETVKFRFLPPGLYSIRIVRDANDNGKWDTGVLTERVWPEKVRIYRNANNKVELEAKENWEIVEHATMKEIFK